MKKTETDVDWLARYVHASVILSISMAVAYPCLDFVFTSCADAIDEPERRNRYRNERIAQLENAEWRDEYAKRKANDAWEIGPDSPRASASCGGDRLHQRA